MGKHSDDAPRRDVPVARQRRRSARERDPLRSQFARFFAGDLVAGGVKVPEPGEGIQIFLPGHTGGQHVER